MAGVALLLLINPLLYATAFDDFHSEAIVVLFAVLTARDLYNGRNRRALVWTAGLLLCGDVAAIYVVALGISAMVTGRKSRLTGGILIVAGGVWLEIISALGANSGSGLTQRYGYLTNGLGPGQQASIVSIIRGMIDHPSRPWTVLHHQWPLIVDVMRPGGLIGVVSPWVLFIAAFTLVPNALIPGTLFIQIGFQNLVVPLFAIIGSLMVVDWCARQDWLSNDRRHGQHTRSAAAKSGPVVGRAVAGVLALAVVVSSVAYAVPRLHQTYRGRLTVSPGTADMLDAASPRISRPTPRSLHRRSSWAGSATARFSIRCGPMWRHLPSGPGCPNRVRACVATDQSRSHHRSRSLFGWDHCQHHRSAAEPSYPSPGHQCWWRRAGVESACWR